MSRGHGRRGRAGGADGPDRTIDHVMEALDRWPDGMHDLGEPTVELPASWPAALIDVHLAVGAARLFGDTIVLYAPAEVGPPDDDGRLEVATIDGQPVRVDRDARVWACDADTGEWVMEGTRFDRWLYGAIDAAALLYDEDGEFADQVFTEDGEVRDPVAVARARAQIKRDPRAPGPRWRLARLLHHGGELDRARRELEEVVAAAPTLGWAWLDLARVSEQLGELAGAVDEAEAAADADPAHEHRAHFLAEAARLAAAAGDQPRRATLAARALAADPELVRAQLAGADDRLAAGELDAAVHLAALARALAPRDLTVIDLVRRVDAARGGN